MSRDTIMGRIINRVEGTLHENNANRVIKDNVRFPEPLWSSFKSGVKEYDTELEMDESKRATDKISGTKDDWQVVYPGSFQRTWRVNRNEMTFVASTLSMVYYKNSDNCVYKWKVKLLE